MEELNPELESFRQQWRAEVSAKTRGDGHKSSNAGPSKQPRGTAFTKLPSTDKPRRADEAEDTVEPQKFGSFDGAAHVDDHDIDGFGARSGKEPESALDHYEQAVERETQGSLGESLDLYRKAFRMDPRVLQSYKNKHFPAPTGPSKAPKINPSNVSETVPNPAHHSLDGPPPSVTDLIAGFSSLAIERAPPQIEGMPAPPCPIAELPEEILVHIFTNLAITDVSSFVRLSLVCKRMAYLVSTEEQIWKRICHGSEIGFGAMHYQWRRDILGEPLEAEPSEFIDSDEETADAIPLSNQEITDSLYADYTSSWYKMFRARPRIRFNGCYISTVNYIRAGQALQSQFTWNSPVHIVTYYRYLRFFRDGTVISLLSTAEPVDVVHHLTKDLASTHRGGGGAHLQSNAMRQALRGRWRLSTLGDIPETGLKESEGDVFIETEGVNERYMYRMRLSLRNAGKVARNNKLVWQGFWNYNILTDDTGEFPLKNDKPFFWSRVKSYGNGA